MLLLRPVMNSAKDEIRLEQQPDLYVVPAPMKAPQRKKLFEDIFARDGGCCVYCGIATHRLQKGLSRSPALATLDHVVPRSTGGPLSRENLVLCCQACNNERGTMDAGAFRARKAGVP
jgi:5-methylcytosine-specific restriction endonuclease McrA